MLPHPHLGLIFFITNNVYTIIVCTNIQIKFRKASKTFETYALQLQVSADIRYKLLGDATAGVKQSYQDWQWDELQDQIHEAHELVLSNFHIDTLYPALIKKADEILDKMGIPSKVFNKKWKC